MSVQRKVLAVVIGWLAVLTLLHLWLNTDVLNSRSGQLGKSSDRFRVGFLPVT